MNRSRRGTWVGALMVAAVICGCGSEETAVVEGDYFGQGSPPTEATLFAPGVVSTPLDELNAVFSPHGREFYSSIRGREAGLTMIVRKRQGDVWQEPEVLWFSGEHGDVDMSLSHDNRQLFFISKRPGGNRAADRTDWDIWVVEREGEAWGEPTNLAAVNAASPELYPTTTRDGSLYFSSDREGGYGGGDIYVSRPIEGGYGPPENLGPPVSSEYGEGDVFVAPDESYLIVSAEGRPDTLGEGDLYISFRSADGSLTEPVNMGARVNSAEHDFCPMLSPDGRVLFFTSRRPPEARLGKRPRSLPGAGGNGPGNTFWIDAAVIEDLRVSVLGH